MKSKKALTETVSENGKTDGKDESKPVISETVSENKEVDYRERLKSILSENVSVNKKRKRGRPRAMSLEDETYYETFDLFENNKSRRGRLNVYYRTIAIGRIKESEDKVREGFTWLFDKKPGVPADECKWKPTILSELGRIEDPGLFEVVAKRICELKPKTKEAVIMIRRVRLGKNYKGREKNPYGLDDAIIKSIDDYLVRYPDTTTEEILDSLASVSEIFQDPEEEK